MVRCVQTRSYSIINLSKDELDVLYSITRAAICGGKPNVSQQDVANLCGIEKVISIWMDD